MTDRPELRSLSWLPECTVGEVPPHGLLFSLAGDGHRMRKQRLPAGMFGSENELCEKLIEVARANGFKAYPETGRWDVLLACRETDDQIGIQGKLRPNILVLDQATSLIESGPGPVIHAALVPIANRSFLRVAKHLRVQVIEGVHLDRFDLGAVLARAPRWQHRSPEWMPEVEVLCPAGVPSPRRMTRWKIQAVKLCLLIRERGYATRHDMTRLKLDPYWWFRPRFGPILEAIKVTVGPKAVTHFVLADPSSPLVPDLRWPEIVEALTEQRAKELEASVDELALIPPNNSNSEIPEAPAAPATPTGARPGPRIRIRVRQSPASEVRVRKPATTMLPPPSQEEIPPHPMPRLKVPVNTRGALVTPPSAASGRRRR